MYSLVQTVAVGGGGGALHELLQRARLLRQRLQLQLLAPHLVLQLRRLDARVDVAAGGGGVSTRQYDKNVDRLPLAWLRKQ